MKPTSVKQLSVRGALLVLLLLSCFCPSVLGQAAVQGQWSTLPYLMPINPVHMALMNNGLVLVVSGPGNVPTNTTYPHAGWDTHAGTTTTQPTGSDIVLNHITV